MEPPRRNPQATSTPSRPDRPSIHLCERSSPVKNRKLEIGTSGSVRGGDGNIPTPSQCSQHARRPPRRRSKAAREGNRGRWAPLSAGGRPQGSPNLPPWVLYGTPFRQSAARKETKPWDCTNGNMIESTAE